MPRTQIEQHQLRYFNGLLQAILPGNRFYAEKLQGRPTAIESLGELAAFPFTTKQELVQRSNSSGFAPNLTFALGDYTHLHRTSGTTGSPLAVLDTPNDWQWWLDTWQYVLDAAAVTSEDRAMMAFSFGPFIGFWSAHDALATRGAMVVPGGGMSTLARLQTIEQYGATILCCTPTYALHMIAVAQSNRIDLSRSPVRALIVAGEPGGSIPSVRKRIVDAWQVDLIDHAGATEIGPWGVANPERNGLLVIESQFIAEFLVPDTDQPAQAEIAELVLTTLGRIGSPVIRYRTGDLVLPRVTNSGFMLLEGGVLGRADDMIIIRGVNVFPSSIEAILREFEAVDEFRITATRQGALDELQVEIEAPEDLRPEVAAELQRRLGFRVSVTSVPGRSLPRFEAKARRFVDARRLP